MLVSKQKTESLAERFSMTFLLKYVYPLWTLISRLITLSCYYMKNEFEVVKWYLDMLDTEKNAKNKTIHWRQGNEGKTKISQS